MYSARAEVTHSPLQRLPQPVRLQRRERPLGLALAAALLDVEAPTRQPWLRFAACSKRPLPRSNPAFRYRALSRAVPHGSRFPIAKRNRNYSPGDALQLDTQSEEIVTLRPVRAKAQIKKEHGVWVYQGEATDASIPALIDREREKRLRDLMG
jgi:hypothetical protein